MRRRRVASPRLAGALASGCALALALALPADALEPAPEGLDASVVARRADDNMRSDRTYFAGRMIVESPRLSGPRTVVFSSWEDRPARRSFIRIHEPAKDRGSGFLKLHPNLWMYVPRVERMMRIPPWRSERISRQNPRSLTRGRPGSG